MNFALLRKNFKGPINKIAYFGMLGDLAVVALIYVYFTEKKKRKARLAAELKAKETESNLMFYPKKISEIDYNKFSPYTPIPYYVSKTTKYQHIHIDLVGYLNENQLNVDEAYYGNYHESYDPSSPKLYDWHDPYNLKKHHHGGHGHH